MFKTPLRAVPLEVLVFAKFCLTTLLTYLVHGTGANMSVTSFSTLLDMLASAISLITMLDMLATFAMFSFYYERKREIERIRTIPEYNALKDARDFDHTVIFAHGLHTVASAAASYTDSSSSQILTIVDDVTDEGTAIDVSTSLFSLTSIPLLPGGKVVSIPCSQWPRYDIGSEADAEKFAKIAAARIRSQDKPVVLFGSSRGSATVFNALVLLQQEKDWEAVLKPRIAFVVCAGTYATVDDAISHRVWRPFRKLVAWIYSRRWLGFVWNSDEPFSPLRNTPLLPSGIPIAFIAAENDENVPVTSTRRLIQRIKEENEVRPAERQISLVDPLFLLHSGHAFPLANLVEARQMMVYMTKLYEDAQKK